MIPHSIQFELNPDSKDVETARNKLRDHERQFLPADDTEELAIVLRDGNGEVVGGIIGSTRYGTLCIDDLWVAERLRGLGYGKRLVLAAERVARERGCGFSSTGTYEVLGVRSFYERLGYRVVSTTIDSPPGHTGYWFHKILDPES